MKAYRFDELRVGMAHGFPAVVTAAMMRRFLEDTGDANPLHVDEELARAQGFAGPVVYGLLAASFYSTLVGVHLPGRHALLQGLQVDFVRPVYVGAPLEVRGEIVHLSAAVRRVEIAATIAAPAGEVYSRAKLRVGVRE
jgi:acyl dehydratase